jgi:hypothetical protein
MQRLLHNRGMENKGMRWRWVFGTYDLEKQESHYGLNEKKSNMLVAQHLVVKRHLLKQMD